MKVNRIRNTQAPPENRRGRNLRKPNFAQLFSLFRLPKPSKWLENNFGFVLLLGGIWMTYIYNAHLAEKQARTEHELKKELQELESDYMALNAKLSMARTQSAVTVVADSLGLKHLQESPYKIYVRSSK